MKVLYSWLKDFVALDISAEETAACLARLGFEIAEVKTFGGKLAGVVTAKVLEKEKHPNADRLSLCKVFDGTTAFSVVCGAPNVAAGQTVPFARLGATLPDGSVLKPARIRGIESQGMICSAEELGLSDSSDGILVLPEDTALGLDVRPLLDLNDTLIEIELTPNRRDALGVIGIARELAAGLNLPLKYMEPRFRELDLSSCTVSITNEAQDLCPRYTARYIRDIKVGPSPAWMVRRLERCGYRSINNIVDITNYVMHELGQPMHAFDAGRLEGRRLRVRRAATEESILTLENKTAVLEEGTLVIADETKPVAIAGVMGGALSAIQPDTTEIVLESAAFNASHVRQSSKKTGIRTESSYRFERGSDWDMTLFASRRAAQLVQELAGGLTCKPMESSAFPPSPVSIKMRTVKIKRFLGMDIRDSVAADILRKLGCEISMGTGQLLVTVPSWRLDLTIEADLLEEIARLYGYDEIPTQHPAIRLSTVPDDRLWSYDRKVSRLLAGLGFSEAFNTSFLSEKQAGPFTPALGQRQDSQPIKVANPLSLDQAVLRTSLLPGLLQNAVLNFRRQNAAVALFEVGRVFFQNHEGVHEGRRISVLLGGEVDAAHWRHPMRKTEFSDMIGVLSALFEALHISGIQFIPFKATAFHPKRCVAVTRGTLVLGWMGEIHPDLGQALDTTEPLVAAELDTKALLESTPSTISYNTPSSFPPVRRDLSVVVASGTTYETISKTLRSAGGKYLESVSLIDIYHGDKIGEGRKSVTIALSFRDKEKTLSDTDVEKQMKAIIGELQSKCDATLRA